MRSLKSFGLVAGFILATNIFGLVRELLTARAMGVEAATDSFFAAFRIISAAFLLFTSGALQAAFMPEYQRLLTAGREAEARSLFRRSFAMLVLLLLGLTATMAVAAPTIVAWVVPGFSVEQQRETTQLLRWLSPLLPTMSLGSLLQAAAHARGKFAAASFVPLANNLVIIAALLLLVPVLSVSGLALGYVAGGALWLVVLAPTFSRAWRGPTANDGGRLASIAGAMPALLALTVCEQLTGIVQQRFVSDLGAGAISALAYAGRLQSLPVGVVAGAFATVSFPALVAVGGVESRTLARRRILEGIGFVTLLTIPTAVVLFLQAAPCVALLFERGAFDATATAATAGALAPYAWSIVPLSAVLYLNRVYYALGDVMTPLRIGVVASCLNVLACWLGVQVFGYAGIAIGIAAYGAVHATLLLWFVLERFSITLRDLANAVWRPFAGAAAMVMVLVAFGPRPGTVALFAGWIAATAVYGAGMWIAGDPILRRIAGRRDVNVPATNSVEPVMQRAA
jgi:putative peptidoglycan lipid II flippase